ncbi:hypothetical protein RDMS_07965 [Deinococcus sp. RL]|nr:hypothetical protein RDMS_07965 [Deinococcus sp. RL]
MLPQAASPCLVEPELASVQIAGLSRGDLPVRLVGSEVWVPAAALRANEANYGAGRATCDGEEYVRLSPALNVQYDPSELTLTVQAAPALLAGGELDFAGTFGDPLPSLPAFSVSGRVDVQRPAGEPLAGLLGVGASLQSGRWRAGADATLSGTLTGEARSLRLGGSLSAEAVLDDVWTVGGVVRLGPGGLGSGFSGLEVRARSPEGTLVPELALELPLEAVVTLLYEERQIARFRAPAGRFVLRNLPLTPEGELLVFIQDERGTRLVTLPLSPTQVRLREGAFAVRAQAGLETGRPVLRASGAYGLSGALTVQGQAELRAEEQSGAASLAGPLGPGRGRVGGAVVRSAATGVTASAQLGYAVPLGPVNAVADLSLPVAPLRAPSVSLGLSYADLRAQASLTGSYDFALREGAVRLSGSYRLTPEWTLQGQGSYRTSGGYGLGLGLTYRLPNGWVLGTGAAADRPAPPDSGGAGGSLSVRGVAFSARLGEHEVALTGPGPWGVRYHHTGVWPLSVQADQTGFWAAQGELGLTWTGGRLLRGVPAEGASLLVRTGVPVLAVRVSGGNVQRADAQGDLFFTGLPAGGSVVLSVDAASLSFEVHVTDSEQPLQLGRAGVSFYDWSANFQRRRWVRFVWPDGSAAAYAVVTVDGRTYSADLDGNVLLDRRLAPGLAVTLRSEDGSRRCTLALTAAEEQRCPALEELQGS